MRYIIVLIMWLVMAPFILGCQERYRYPCQDPRNWEEEYCKKPYCSANGTCPEDLRHYNKNNGNGNGGQSNQICSGSCK